LKSLKKDANVGPSVASRSRSSFVRMLQQLPRVTQAKAAELSKYYPTVPDLMEAYRGCEDNEER